MATDKKGGTNIRYDEFVKLVKPDPGATDQVVLLQGYVGASTSDDKIRLYSDESLAEYADISKTDIIYSLPNNDDPLGGSRLWVNQSANINYGDASGYSQGDMYNEYMQNSYEPATENFAGAGAATSPLICTRPITKLIFCHTRPAVCRITVPWLCPPRPTRQIFCPVTCAWGTRRPPVSIAGCPSDFCGPDITRTINPGVGGGQFADDYSGGDMYNDYMQNSYEPDAENFAGAGAPSSPLICHHPITRNTNCFSRPIICRISVPVWRCWKPTRPIFCPITCVWGTRRPPVSLAGCPSNFCGPDITRTINPGETIINPGVGGGQFADDYSGGDMYNDYMQNSYEPDAENFAGAGAPSSPLICHQPISRNSICISKPIICRISVPAWRCWRPTRPIFCPITCVWGTRRPPVSLAGCPSDFCGPDITRTINPGETIINPGVGGGQFADDYSGGDMYNDYMQNNYEPGTEDFAGAGAATSPLICHHPITRNTNCFSRHIICRISVPVWRCQIHTIRSICRPCIPTNTITGTRTFPSAVDGCPSQWGCTIDTTRTIRTTVINPGDIGGGYNDYYGY